METRVQYFDCLCRTCMNKVEVSSHGGSTIPPQQWLSIFDIFEECGALRIAELLSDAVPQIVVQPSDELPKKICTECLQRLLTVYRFQQMCVQSDKEMHELLSKEQTVLKTPMLEGAIKGETEINEADAQPLKELRCSSTLHNLQQPSIQEALAEVTVQTIEQEAAESSAANHLQDNTQLLEYCNNSQDEFEELIKNEPIEDDEEANSEYSDGETMHSIVSVTKEEVLPIEIEDQQVNESEAAQSSAENLQDNSQLLEQCNNSQGVFDEFIKNETIEDDEEANSEYSEGDTIHSTISVSKEEVLPIEFEDQQLKYASSRHNCHLCNRSYKKRQYLIKHLNEHKKKANNSKIYCYACHLCSESYKKEWILVRHLTREHSKDLHLRYTCDVCNKGFASWSGLRYHIPKHTAEQPYVGPECRKSFTAQSIPAEQRTTHAEDKPYECPYCPLRFSSKRNASRHKTVHEGIKPHKCSICGKKFRRNSDLMRHKRIHSNEKPHKCDQCEKRFIQMQNLKVHIRTHTGERPYKCNYFNAYSFT